MIHRPSTVRSASSSSAAHATRQRFEEALVAVDAADAGVVVEPQPARASSISIPGSSGRAATSAIGSTSPRLTACTHSGRGGGAQLTSPSPIPHPGDRRWASRPRAPRGRGHGCPSPAYRRGR